MPTNSAIDIDLSQAATLGNQLIDQIGALRAREPVHFSEANGGIWIVSGHKQVAEAFAGKLPLSSRRLPELVMTQIDPTMREQRYPYIYSITRDWVINMDRPDSWRLRNLATSAFSKRAAEAMRPHVRRFIAEAFDAVVGQEDCVEFVDAVARRVPARTILHLFGLPLDVYPRLHRWASSLNAGLSNPGVAPEILDAAEVSIQEMVELLRPEIEKRRLNPTDDFISQLVTARDGNDKLSENELVAMLLIVLIAGHDTTANTIALSAAALAGLPEARQYIRANPDMIGNSVMELMRYVAMSTAMARIAVEDFEWEGQQIKAGSFVLLMIAGANRDPSTFSSPETFVGDRPQEGNMTFAPGQHFCIGHWLAKLQVEETLQELLERYDPVVLDETLNFGAAIGFRGLETLNIALRPV